MPARRRTTRATRRALGRLHAASLFTHRLIANYIAHGCSISAAALSYYTLLTSVPLLLAAVAGLGFLLGSSDPAFRSVLEATARIAPGSVDTISDVITKVIASKTGVGLIALASLVWTGSAVFGVLEHAMDAAWRVEKRRGVLHSKLRGAVLVILTGLALLLSLLLTSVARLHASQLQSIALGGLAHTPGFWRYVAVLVQFLLSACAFTVLIRLVPNRWVPLHCAVKGGILTATLWELSKHLFAQYVTRVAPYSGMYGPIGGIIALVVWMYYSASIVILGAEFTALLASGPSVSTTRPEVEHLPPRSVRTG